MTTTTRSPDRLRTLVRIVLLSCSTASLPHERQLPATLSYSGPPSLDSETTCSLQYGQRPDLTMLRHRSPIDRQHSGQRTPHLVFQARLDPRSQPTTMNKPAL